MNDYSECDPKKIVTDAEIKEAFNGTYSRCDQRAVLINSLLMVACGLYVSYSQKMIMNNLKMITPTAYRLTKKGKHFLYYSASINMEAKQIAPPPPPPIRYINYDK